eukprot:SM000023S07708  [mRNA]  locus=s23:971814:974634:- [translate_table: standard]
MGTTEGATPLKTKAIARALADLTAKGLAALPHAQQDQPVPSQSGYPLEWSAAFQAYYGQGGQPPPAYYPPPPPGGTPQGHPYMAWSGQHMMPPYGTPPPPYGGMYPPGGMYGPPQMPPFGMPGPGPSGADPAAAAAMKPQSVSEPEENKAAVKDKAGVKPGGGGGSGGGGGKAAGVAATVSPSQAKSGVTLANNGALAVGQSADEDSEDSDDDDGDDSSGPNMGDKAAYSQLLAEGGKGGGLGMGMEYWHAGSGGGSGVISGGGGGGGSGGGGKKRGPGGGGMGQNMPPELWLQDEREVKRQRRKQSNRESARRSRLRKQAECEELAQRVDTLNAENVQLRAELVRLNDECRKLTQDNTSIQERLSSLRKQPQDAVQLHGGSSHQPTDDAAAEKAGAVEAANNGNEAGLAGASDESPAGD